MKSNLLRVIATTILFTVATALFSQSPLGHKPNSFSFPSVMSLFAPNIFASIHDNNKRTTNGAAAENSGVATTTVSLKAGDKNSKDLDGDGVKNKKDMCPETPAGIGVDDAGCPIDQDNDNVPDYLDKCPMAIGPVTLNGCPDGDYDGVSDIDDGCPDVPGLTRFAGCPDSDGDGIDDANDKCPNLKGLDQFKGCPDSDGDGVDDVNDKCPNTERGIKVDANGCMSDSDHDGIIDSDDKCPDTQKGIKVDAHGCPADTDGDGVIDTNDKCPTTKGEGTTNGCPAIKPDIKKRLDFAARGINFESGKATLVASSYPMLNEVLSILNAYSDYDLKIGGYTDNVGSDDMNYQLSQSRVASVQEYLQSKGIMPSRIDAKGYGETNPVASNESAEGRTKNRRVELELYIK